jgi:hypothetical protein
MDLFIIQKIAKTTYHEEIIELALLFYKLTSHFSPSSFTLQKFPFMKFTMTLYKR